MKKIIVILLLIILTACKSTKEMTIIVPSGAPSLAFYKEVANDNFMTSDAKGIIPEFQKGSSDILVIDTINGIKLLNEGAPYKLAANLTFGNFYLASTSNDLDKVLDVDDYLVLFAQNSTADLIFNDLYEDIDFNNIHYVNNVNEASACLINGINVFDENNKVDYVLIAEPLLTSALKQNPNAYIYQNLQELYFDKYQQDMIQASVFVNEALNKEEAEKFLMELEKNINELLVNPSLFKEYMLENKIADLQVKDLFGINNYDLIYDILINNSISLNYKKAVNNKKAIDLYLKMFNLEETSEKIYY